MSRANAMNRRRFLLLNAGIGGTLLAAPGLAWLASHWQGQENTLHSRLVMLLQHRRSATVIGRTYLTRFPQEENVHVLLTKIVADPGASTDRSLSAAPGGADRPTGADDHELRDLLQRRIQQDFVEEHVVKLEGWILSATEARLCALTALA